MDNLTPIEKMNAILNNDDYVSKIASSNEKMEQYEDLVKAAEEQKLINAIADCIKYQKVARDLINEGMEIEKVAEEIGLIPGAEQALKLIEIESNFDYETIDKIASEKVKDTISDLKYDVDFYKKANEYADFLITIFEI